MCAATSSPLLPPNWDFNLHASAYVSYTDIFDVNNAYDARGKMVPPTTGTNWELGLKTEWMDKRLTGSIALYQTDRKNQIRRDPSTPYPLPGLAHQRRLLLHRRQPPARARH